MSSKQHKVKVGFLTLSLFLVTGGLFQNCSLSKFDSAAHLANGGGLNDSFSSYAPRSMSGLQNVSNGNAILKEYRYMALNRFFYTSRVNDQALLESTYSSVFETGTQTITLKANQAAGLSPVYRLYNKAGFHLYTADSSEQNTALSNPQYVDEGIEGYAIKINPGATCPTSSFPVNRLFDSAQSKYRLVTDSNLITQLVSQGYDDQGILFCATAVSTSAPPVSNLSCDFNGTNLAHGASVVAYQSAVVSQGSNCLSQVRTCNNGSLSGSYLSRTCTVSAPVSGTASCALGSTILAHGQSGIGYNSPSVPTGSNCISQSVTCNNGALSNPSYSFSSCSVAAPTSDLCAGQNVFVASNFAIDASSPFQRRWSTSGGKPLEDISHQMRAGDVIVIPFNVSATTTTQGTYPASFNYSDAGSERGGKIVSISQRRCDFTSSVKLWISQSAAAAPLGSNSSSAYAVLNDSSAAHSSYTNLTTGQWYINIKVPVGSCPIGSYCDFVLDYAN